MAMSLPPAPPSRSPTPGTPAPATQHRAQTPTAPGASGPEAGRSVPTPPNAQQDTVILNVGGQRFEMNPHRLGAVPPLRALERLARQPSAGALGVDAQPQRPNAMTPEGQALLPALARATAAMGEALRELDAEEADEQVQLALLDRDLDLALKWAVRAYQSSPSHQRQVGLGQLLECLRVQSRAQDQILQNTFDASRP